MRIDIRGGARGSQVPEKKGQLRTVIERAQQWINDMEDEELKEDEDQELDRALQELLDVMKGQKQKPKKLEARKQVGAIANKLGTGLGGKSKDSAQFFRKNVKSEDKKGKSAGKGKMNSEI